MGGSGGMQGWRGAVGPPGAPGTAPRSPLRIAWARGRHLTPSPGRWRRSRIVRLRCLRWMLCTNSCSGGAQSCHRDFHLSSLLLSNLLTAAAPPAHKRHTRITGNVSHVFPSTAQHWQCRHPLSRCAARAGTPPEAAPHQVRGPHDRGRQTPGVSRSLADGRMPHAARRTPQAARSTPQTRLQSLPGVGSLLPGPRKQGGRGALPALANVCRSAALVPCRALGAGDQQAA